MLDRFVIPTAVQVDIALVKLSVQEIDLVRWDIDVIEQLFLEPATVRLWAVGGQAIVFVQRKQDNARQVQPLFTVQSNQLSKGR